MMNCADSAARSSFGRLHRFLEHEPAAQLGGLLPAFKDPHRARNHHVRGDVVPEGSDTPRTRGCCRAVRRSYSCHRNR